MQKWYLAHINCTDTKANIPTAVAFRSGVWAEERSSGDWVAAERCLPREPKRFPTYCIRHSLKSTAQLRMFMTSFPSVSSMLVVGKSKTPLMEVLKKHSDSCYYAYSLVIFQLLFLTVNFDSDRYNIYTSEETSRKLNKIFIGAFAVGAPLIYDFLLDQSLAWCYPKYSKALSNHRMADMLIISSMFVTGIIGLLSDKFTLEFAYIIVGLGQCLLLCGLYGRLLSLSHAKWSTSVCALLVSVYTASQIVTVHHIRDCGTHHCINRNYLIIGIALNALCLALHLFFSKHLFIRSDRVAVNAKTDDQQFIPKYSQMLNVAIITLYLLARLVFLSVELSKHGFSAKLLECKLFLLICVAVVAGALPGRIVRLGMTSLKSEMEYKETFVRYISHEIRSPLSTTTLGLDFLLQQMSSKAITYEEAIDVIKDAKISADLATSTMNDLLMFDKISTSKFEIFTTVTRAWGFIVNCVRPFRTQTRVSKLDLTCTIDTPQHKDITLLIDQPKIEQVVRNFLTNAIKFTQAGGTLAMQVSVQPAYSNGNPSNLSVGDMGIMRISLSDTGPGISKENLPKLFGQYVQFDANKLQHGSGSGLGLWLSKSIIEMHGGYIGALSEGEGHGCVFYFELPCYAHVSRNNGSASSTSSKSMAQSIRYYASASMRHDNTPNWDDNEEASENSGRSMHSFAGNSVSSSIKNTVRAHVQDLAHRLAAANGAPMGDFHCAPVSDRSNAPITDRSNESGGLKQESVRGSESSDSKGPTTYSLQVSPTHANTKMPTATASQKGPRTPRKVERLLRVLLADDAPLSRKMVARTLQEFCQTIEHASNGLDALNAVLESIHAGLIFDVVIIDNYMPVMNGSDAIASMRRHGFKGVVLAATGSTSQDDHDLLIKSGADAVILKPLNMQTFKTVMNELMELSKIDLPMKF